jgi:hypothetical protein
MTDITLDDVAAALRDHEDPVTTAPELADRLDCSRRHALDMLRLLERAGDADSKRIGGRAIAWWHVDRVRSANEVTTDDVQEASVDEDNGGEEDVVEQVVDEASELWGDTGDRLQQRRAVVRVVLNAIRDEPASKSELIDRYYDEYPVKGQGKQSWWRNNLTEGAAPLRRVAEYRPATHEWVWTGLDEE